MVSVRMPSSSEISAPAVLARPATPSTSEPQNETLISDTQTAESIEIVMQPENTSGYQGDTVWLNVVVIGDGLAYQWQRSTDGIEWTDIRTDSNVYHGAQTPELSFIVGSNTASRQYRCMISNGEETVMTFAVTIVIVEEATTVSEEEPQPATDQEPVQDQPENQQQIDRDGLLTISVKTLY